MEEFQKLAELLQYNEGEEFGIDIPNEIFPTFQCNMKNTFHVAFGYSYYYLVSYLYRYAKYGSKEPIDIKKIKQLLGYNPNEKRVDYIVKADGVLDEIGWTQGTYEYPIFWRYDENKRLSFITNLSITDIAPGVVLPLRKLLIKKPLKAFYREENISKLDGTFYDSHSTHNVPVSFFIRMMSDPSGGVLPFYVYGYLKQQVDLAQRPYKASYETLERKLQLGRKAIAKYVSYLKGMGFIQAEIGKPSAPSIYLALSKLD